MSFTFCTSGAIQMTFRGAGTAAHAKLQGGTVTLTPSSQTSGDDADIASRQIDRMYQMKLASKERKLLNQINLALGKFEDGDYGICEGSGEVIHRKRLEMRPWTRYSVEYKEQLERQKGTRGTESDPSRFPFE